MKRLRAVLARTIGALPFLAVGVAALAVISFAVAPALAGERSSVGSTRASQATALAYENQALGYQLSLPDPYRRVGSTFAATNAAQLVGRDTFTLQTQDEERIACLADSGTVPPLSAGATVEMTVFVAAPGLSPVAWAGQSAFKSPRATVEPATVNGESAARITADGEMVAYVVRANGRFYALSPSRWPTQHNLDDIISTFHAIPPQSQPSPTAPPMPPRDAAAQQAKLLASAFTARDATAIEGFLLDCRFGVSAAIEPVLRGSEVCCILNRSSDAFIEALRGLFASGTLTVVADQEVQVLSESEGNARNDFFYVKSIWSTSDRTTPVDLFLREIEGRWYWTNARHHYQRTELAGEGTCLRYTSPWLASGGAQC